jgi:hypothetical protein
MGNCWICKDEEEGSVMEAYGYYFRKDHEVNRRLTPERVRPPRPSAPPLSPN